MYVDEKPTIIKIGDYFKGSGFVGLSGKKDQGKIPQNVSEEKFRESGQLNKVVENKDVLLRLLTMSQYQDDLKKTAPSYETLSYSNVKVSQRKNLGRVDS